MADQPTTPDASAFDAVRGVLVDPDGGFASADATGVLERLGIPLDATADDVRAAMLLWRNDWHVSQNTASTTWTAWGESWSHDPVVMAETKAAAVLALAAKLTEDGRL